MTDKKIDLAAEGLLAGTEPVTGEQPLAGDQDNKATPNEEELTEFVTRTLLSVQDSLGSMQIGLRIMNERIAGLEKYVAYLLEKDPVVGPKLKAQADKEEAAAKANAAAEAAKAADQGQG
jgi:hypothetical protein